MNRPNTHKLIQVLENTLETEIEKSLKYFEWQEQELVEENYPNFEIISKIATLIMTLKGTLL